jgi:hypothetical protein
MGVDRIMPEKLGTEPIIFSVDIQRNPSATLYTSGPLLSDSSSLLNKKITNVTFTYRSTDSLDKIIKYTQTINVEYKLGDGKTLTMSDVKFQPNTTTGTCTNVKLLGDIDDTDIFSISEQMKKV